MSRHETKDEKADPADEKPAAAAGTGAAAEPADEQLLSARREAAANHDKYVRAVADLENFRRRAVREKEELRLYASSRLLEDLLPALDNLALGLSAARQPGADMRTVTSGVELVQQQMKAALAAHGLKEVNPVGEAFDPHQHEAISHQPDPGVEAEHVISVTRTGYQLNGRLVRPASVVVSSGKASKPHAH
ncbi:MAG TPA: nucleotide exchange factor GrpE [Opitutaceae bacterium]